MTIDAGSGDERPTADVGHDKTEVVGANVAAPTARPEADALRDQAETSPRALTDGVTSPTTRAPAAGQAQDLARELNDPQPANWSICDPCKFGACHRCKAPISNEVCCCDD